MPLISRQELEVSQSLPVGQGWGIGQRGLGGHQHATESNPGPASWYLSQMVGGFPPSTIAHIPVFSSVGGTKFGFIATKIFKFQFLYFTVYQFMTPAP